METCILVINQIPSTQQYEVLYALFECATYQKIIDWLATYDSTLQNIPGSREKKYAALRQLKHSAMESYKRLLISIVGNSERKR